MNNLAGAAIVIVALLSIMWLNKARADQSGQSGATKGAVSLSCPDISLGETEEDCPWAGFAKALNQNTETEKAFDKFFESYFTEQKDPAGRNFLKQLKADSKRGAWKDLWGQSLNFDEQAKLSIVNPAVLDAIASRLELPKVKDQVAHAGMAHTYGYLFSTLKTAYGFKRARWVRDDLEAGFGIPRGLLGPSPFDGTLFSNVTFFLGRIGLRDNEEAQKALLKGVEGIPSALRDYNFLQLEIDRLEETVLLADKRKIVLRTDLVKFPKTFTGKPNHYLLIYTVAWPEQHTAKLITGFPINTEFANQITHQKNSDQVTITSRYNAFIEGVTGHNLSGKRQLVTE